MKEPQGQQQNELTKPRKSAETGREGRGLSPAPPDSPLASLMETSAAGCSRAHLDGSYFPKRASSEAGPRSLWENTLGSEGHLCVSHVSVYVLYVHEKQVSSRTRCSDSSLGSQSPTALLLRTHGRSRVTTEGLSTLVLQGALQGADSSQNNLDHTSQIRYFRIPGGP